MEKLKAFLDRLNGCPYDQYQSLPDYAVDLHPGMLRFKHIQGSPGADPGSVAELSLGTGYLGIPASVLSVQCRRLACADYILRAFQTGMAKFAAPNKGDEGSGSFQPLELPQQILERNVVDVSGSEIRIRFRISLPGSTRPPVILADAAEEMLCSELPAIIQSLRDAICEATGSLEKHCDVAEDYNHIRGLLAEKRYIAFVRDGSILPRASGISDAPPDQEAAVPFIAPDELAVDIETPNAGMIRGLGIPEGVTLVIGGGFHGKSTLLNALSKGVYPHIPGDGREYIVTRSDAQFVSAEDGRAVTGTDISFFMKSLPGDQEPESFFTQNASGSTSQAAGIVEAVNAGAGILLLDEDCSATNFLIRDARMRRLIPDEPIISLLERARQLYSHHGVSIVLVAGGSSEFLGIADTVICMHSYKPVDYTAQARKLDIAAPPQPESGNHIKADRRQLDRDNFSPAYNAIRLGKEIPLRIKSLRLEPRVLEYGNDKINLRSLAGLVDNTQTLAIGYALLYLSRRTDVHGRSPSGLATHVGEWLDCRPLQELTAMAAGTPAFLAKPRALDVAAAINRIRSLKLKHASAAGGSGKEAERLQ